MHNHNNNNNINRNHTEHKAFLAEAHTDFQHSVTNGISKLRESGFSKQRAIEILLKFIRQQDDVPKDDEVRVFILKDLIIVMNGIDWVEIDMYKNEFILSL